jgi:hypothetical protein
MYFPSGIFKNNQAQVDEYLNALNPLLRRTTEGKINLNLNTKNAFIKQSSPAVSSRTSSRATNPESESARSRMH